jgi:quercetin dioxygenase-like cupin family protein
MTTSIDRQSHTSRYRIAALLAGGLVAATFGSAAALEREGPHDWGIIQIAASAMPPTEHVGLTVDMLGVVPAESMQATIGLEGHVLQLRAITIAPGGQIAAHPHTTRPGLVKVVAGEWVEGRPEGETTYDANGSEGIVEDERTTHWFFNRGTTPATALVCDIVPAS